MDNYSKDLLELSLATGYPIIQENGQRRFGPPPGWKGDPPERGSEIFIGNIPRDCFEKEILPIFQPIGKIYELRLMMDFSGYHRGFAFLMFYSPAEADQAIKWRNNCVLRGKRIGVMKSYENNRLCITSLPKNRSKEEIKHALLQEIKNQTENVKDVVVHGEDENSRFSLVEYSSHRAAAIARRTLVVGKLTLWNQVVSIDWANPVPKAHFYPQDSVLIAQNLPLGFNEERLKNIFSLNGELPVKEIKKKERSSMIYYHEKSDSEKAFNLLNNIIACFSSIMQHKVVITKMKVRKSSNNNKIISRNSKQSDNFEAKLNYTCSSSEATNTSHPATSVPRKIFSPFSVYPKHYLPQNISYASNVYSSSSYAYQNARFNTYDQPI